MLPARLYSPTLFCMISGRNAECRQKYHPRHAGQCCHAIIAPRSRILARERHTQHMIEEIQTKLNEITAANQVRILYACESGSRAWGFPSADSVYDVRFIYLHTPDTYLSIDEPRDTIDLPVNEVLDINGWDLKKALRLFRGSNAALYEWILSPVVYAQSGAFRTRIHTIMNDYFSPKDGMHHYIGVARNSFSALTGEEVKLKKYFY